ncbi:glutaredoxin family protein [Bacillus sp. FJAT-49736]|uniref:glutaredoxin family protein n=1 Tax=Bacillus sp. FJAT-49736 TaxID=2833582 RepID=UPI001BC92734|nr:glutaredoxin family protein [Bacillus sp. FJAT-49736]
MQQVILYSRKQCHLCEDARIILQELQQDYSFEIKEKDIDSNDEWTQNFGLMIPVVEIDGEIIQYGQIDSFTVSECLRKKVDAI